MPKRPTPTTTAFQTEPELAPLLRALCNWYQAHHRKLPWRDISDPYAIWVSEIMLQQTQVATVVPYYTQFLAKFPTLAALAKAPESAVLKAWEGLGYYSRARNLQKAARHVVETLNGQMPTTQEALQKLPGVGRYTAGAIASFAYGARAAILDGNVKRVLSRWWAIQDPIDTAATTHRLWQLAEAVVAATDDPATCNQALMELGALICVPESPRCLVCPVVDFCAAAKQGIQNQLPVRSPRPAVPKVEAVVGIIYGQGKHTNKILIQQRPSKGLLGGLWEFPGGKRDADEPLEAALQRELQEELGVQVTDVVPLSAPAKHAYTHFKVTLHGFVCRLADDSPEPATLAGQPGFKWVAPKAITDEALPKATHKLLAIWAKDLA